MNTLLEKKYYHLINNQIIEQGKFTYSALGKALEKQIKTMEDQGEKQFLLKIFIIKDWINWIIKSIMII